MQEKLDQAVGIDLILDNLLQIIQQEKETTMTENVKHWHLAGKGDVTTYATLAAATDQAKRYVAGHTARSGGVYNVYELVATVTAPVPEAIVTAI